MKVRSLISMLCALCMLLICTVGCYRASAPLEDDTLEQIDSGTDTTTSKPTPTPVAGPLTPNNSPLIMQLADLEIDEQSTYPTLAFRIFDFDDEVQCSNVIPESSNQSAIYTTTEGEPNETAMTYGDITITGGDSTKCGIAISTRYAAADPVMVSLTLSDGKGATKSYFEVKVLSTNTAPTGSGGQVNITMDEDSGAKSILLHQFSDSTLRGNPARLEFHEVTKPNKGVLGSYPNDAGAGGQSITYTPNANENGSDSFSYKVCDNDPGVVMCSEVQTVSLSIAAVNDPPQIASIDSKTTRENESIAFTFSISDIDSSVSCSNLSYSSNNTSFVSDSGSITFSGNASPNCSASISPTQAKSGASQITFTLTDGVDSYSESFTLNVEGINHAPTIGLISDLSATEDQNFDVSFTANDEDGTLTCESANLSYTSSNTSKIAANNAVSWSGTWPNCKGTVTPVPNAFTAVENPVELTFKVTDGSLTAERKFKVSISNVPDSPTGIVKCASSTSNQNKVGKNSASWSLNCDGATDPDNETLTYKLVKQDEKDLNGITCTDPISSTGGSFSGQFAASPNYGTCIYKVKACDASNQCTPLSSFEVQITSYQLDISTVATPTLSSACVASSSATFSFSNNISSMNHTAKTGINSETGQTTSTSTSPVNFSYTLTDFLNTRTQSQETANLTAQFNVNNATFNNSVDGGAGVTGSKNSAGFKVRREMESILPRWPSNFTSEEVNLDGFQPAFNSTSNTCRMCNGNLISLSASSTHTCVTENSSLKCMGNNSDSKLGTGSTTNSNYPIGASLTGFAALQVSSGSNFTCVLGLNSTTPEIRCAGSNSSGQLGLTSGYSKFDSSAKRVVPPTNHTPIAVAAAKFGEFACGIFNESGGSNGKVFCWGNNDHGQLGNNSNTTPSAGSLVEISGTQGNSSFFALSAGASHACGVKKDGSLGNVYCWGAGNVGQLGNNSSADNTTPVQVDTTIMGSEVAQVTAGLNHTCALTTAGKVYCWGSGELGQLGIGGTTSYTSPQHVSATAINEKVVQISAGAYHTCALLNSHEIYCWGFGSSGQLGLGANTTTDGSSDDCNTASGVQNVAYCKKEPEKVSFSLTSGVTATLISISAGAEHTCAVTIEGNGYCWGRNLDGRLGISTTTDTNSPSNMCSSASNCTALNTLRPRMCSTYSIP